MNNISKSSDEKLKIFKGIVVTTSTMAESRSNQVSNMVFEMGGKYHVDFPKTTNVLVIDIAGLPTFDTILKSKKYHYALTQKLDTIIIDFEMLSTIYNLQKSNQFNKIHPILLGGGNGISVKNDEFLKHIMLNLLRIKYSIKPFDLLKNKVNIFFGKFLSSNEISNFVNNIKNNISGKNALGLNINEKHYVTQVSDEARESCIFITELNSGVRIAAAKKDRVPVVHIQWLIDVVQRNLMISYKPYMLNDETSTDNKYLHDKMLANRCWRNTDLKELKNGMDLARQVFDEFEIIDNKLIIKNNLKNKVNNTVWDKIMKVVDTPNIKETNFTKEVQPLNIAKNHLERDGTIEQFVMETNYFRDCHILSYGFSEKHNTILNKTFEKLDCSTYKAYYEKDFNEEYDSSMEADYERAFGDKSKKCIIVIPHNLDVKELPLFLKKEYMQCLNLFEQNKLNWKYTNTMIVTEFHVERCLFFKKYLDPDCWSLPFYNRHIDFSTYKEGTDFFNWTMSGFEGVEVLHMNKIIKLTDSLKDRTRFVYSKTLNSGTDLLIVNLSKIMCVQRNKSGQLYDTMNKYLKSFKTEEERLIFERQTNKNADIDSNSYLIKKLNFIKHSKRPIPSVTPGLLFEIFYKFNTLQLGYIGHSPEPKDLKVKINDTKWCITCPQKNSEEIIDANGQQIEQFEFLLNIKEKETVEDAVDDAQVAKDPLILLNNNFARPEALDISPTKLLNKNTTNKDPQSENESPSRSLSPHKLKKQKLNRSPLKMVNEQNSEIPKPVNTLEKLGYLFDENVNDQSSQISYGQKRVVSTPNTGINRVNEQRDELDTRHHSLLRRSMRKRSTR
ncbi:uncharacterized protein HGUI_02732 [Hanseniaspora guilliermondii]|uniref:BRCT domain-containing protein n=1 Tax=Hanseniaspora guilliermondii TaxID=56406 RepID=A0A1L0B3Z9_9ASCO|nr:uncharacterized protein HGUI_02732 [Hanseniaspora guilliermondii]